ncbi:hypothetical protein WA158_002747 [Blastocystis sp. Blastoise]
MLSKFITKNTIKSVCLARTFATGQWSKITQAPPDAILGLNEQFKADTDPRKISLGVGAYRDDNGKPVVLPSVLEAEKKIAGKMDHEYPPIQGLANFNKLAAGFAYGEESPAFKENRIATCQALSGTGSLRLLGDFFKQNNVLSKVYIPLPTWPNHFGVFKAAGLETPSYQYLDPKTQKLDLNSILSSIKSAPNGSAFLFHACAHNPTGVDPSHEDWMKISDAIKAKNHYIIFDCAYQGFASGNMEGDAWAIRYFVSQGHTVTLAQSFAKNFGLYGERCGCASVVCESAEEQKKVTSQLKIAARTLWSNPPLYGARIVEQVLGDPKLKAQWYKECGQMASRIISMRSLLVENLKKNGSKKDWSHITSQIGMFAFTGLTKEQVLKVRKDYHIYLTDNGRISMAGVNTHNVEYIAKAFYEVTK